MPLQREGGERTRAAAAAAAAALGSPRLDVHPVDLTETAVVARGLWKRRWCAQRTSRNALNNEAAEGCCCSPADRPPPCPSCTPVPCNLSRPDNRRMRQRCGNIRDPMPSESHHFCNWGQPGRMRGEKAAVRRTKLADAAVRGQAVRAGSAVGTGAALAVVLILLAGLPHEPSLTQACAVWQTAPSRPTDPALTVVALELLGRCREKEACRSVVRRNG